MLAHVTRKLFRMNEDRAESSGMMVVGHVDDTNGELTGDRLREPVYKTATRVLSFAGGVKNAIRAAGER